jgi:glycosyltransferase involved in cell wall biosynthesis
VVSNLLESVLRCVSTCSSFSSVKEPKKSAPVQEVITNGINGLLVDFFRPDQLAQTLSNVLDRPADFNQMRKKARETVLAKYDLGSCLQQRLAWLSSLIASK